MILVTGISGFIGRHLIKALIAKFGKDNVLALTSVPTNDCSYILHNNYQFDNEFFETSGYHDKIETVIHLGAFIPKSTDKVNDILNCNRNIYTTEKLLNTNMPKLANVLFISSVDVYGSSGTITESSSIMPESLYGLSKFYGEQMVSYWSNKANINHQILRIGHVYGPGEEKYKKLIPTVMKRLRDNQTLEIWGDGSDLRSFIYIDDVVNAILASISLRNIGPINVVGGIPISILELVENIIKISGKTARVKLYPTGSPAKNLIFDNRFMRRHLITSETPLMLGLKNEWNNLTHLI